MAFLCPVRIKKHKRKGVPPRQLDAPLPGRITGSDSIDTLVRVGLEKEQGPRARMVVVHDFVPCVDDELAVNRDQQVQVLYQENDWLYVITEEGREGFIPYTYCLPVERSVDDFVLPKSRRAYLTQSGLTGGHIKAEQTKATGNLTRTDSKSMPDITRGVEQRQRQQPVGQSAQDQNRNTIIQAAAKSQSAEYRDPHQHRSRESTRSRQHEQNHKAAHQRPMSSDRRSTASRDSSRSREMPQSQSQLQSESQWTASQNRLQGQSRESSRTRQPSNEHTLSRSFSTSFNVAATSGHQQAGQYKSAPTSPDVNRHRRESPSHDYYNLLPLEVTQAIAQKAVIVKNSSSRSSHNSSGYARSDHPQYSGQRSWHSSASNPNLDRPQQKPQSHSSRSSHSSNSPRTAYQQHQSNQSVHQQKPKEHLRSQENLSYDHNKPTYNHEKPSHNHEKPAYNHQKPSYNHKNPDKSSYNHRTNASFNQNSPFYQPGQSATLPRNFAAAASTSRMPSKQYFQRTQSLHESHPSQNSNNHHYHNHQRQNSLPAHYDPADQSKSQHDTSSSSSTFEKRTYGQYIALFSYSPRQENDIGVDRGEFVTLLNKDDEDWYWIRKGNRHEGFVPKSFLCPAEGQGQEDGNSNHRASRSQHQRPSSSANNTNSSSNTYPRHHHHAPTTTTTPPASTTGPRPMSPAPVSPPPTFSMERATKLVCLYDYKASAPDDLSVTRAQWLYADLDRQPDPDWLWVYSPNTRKTGYIPRTYAKPPNFGSLSNIKDPFQSP